VESTIYSINWKDNCSYIATVVKNQTKNPKLPPYEGEKVTVKLLNVCHDTLTIKYSIRNIVLFEQLKKVTTL